MAKSKKFKASFEIELNKCDKADAHKRLSEYGTPGAFCFGQNFHKENGELFELKGFLFIHASPDYIKKMKGDDKGLKEFCEWARHNYTSGHRRNYDDVGIYKSNGYRWVRFPNGLWCVGDWNDLVTCKDGDLSNRPVQKKGHSGYLDWFGMNCARKWDIKNGKPLFGGLYSVDGKTWRLYEKITKEFGDAWRIARDKYKKELKKSGTLEKRNQHEADKKYAERTNIRMKVATQTAKLRDELEIYLKCLNDESMTVAQVGDIYSELITLAELNKKMKSVYGTKMPKE